MSASLAAKRGSRERLKVRRRCGCSLCARQMRCTELSEMPAALAIARPVQWVAWCSGCVQVSATTRAVVFRRERRFARLAGFVAQQTFNPGLGKALLPPPYRRPADADALRHPRRRVSIGRGEHDARPFDVLARPVAVGRDRRQLLALRSAHNHTYPLSHRPHTPSLGPLSHILTLC